MNEILKKELKKEIKNDLCNREIQERELYDTGFFYDGYLKALFDFNILNDEEYNAILEFKNSFNYKGV